MTLGYKVYADAVMARAQATALWDRYSAVARSARGLPPGASLDTRGGIRVEPPVTVRYVQVVTAVGELRACIPIDDFAAALNGQVIGGTLVDTAGYVAADALPPLLRTKVTTTVGTTTVVAMK